MRVGEIQANEKWN